jgi:hypothetical protein
MSSKDDDIKYESNFPHVAGPLMSLLGGIDSICATDEDGNKGYGSTDEEARQDLESKR